MLTLNDIISASRKINKKPDDSDLRRLPYRKAYIYGRVSSPAQVRDSRESIREIATLVNLAKSDGYKTNFTVQDIEERLKSIQAGTAADQVWEDEEVTVDVRDLGLSGQKSPEQRIGLAFLQKQINEGHVGAVYLGEGVSRLSRDRDHILPYQLLKILKESQCRIRTPEGIWNPALERDCDELADEFEDAIDELKVLRKRLYRKKRQKAARGEFVGEPIPPGFIVPVIGTKANGEYLYGKMKPHPPHAEIDMRILREYVRQGGSKLKTVRALAGLTFPFFLGELAYMERLSALRDCAKTPCGYRISPSLIRGLVGNLKLIGIWLWGDCEPIVGNHEPAVPEDLFLTAYNLAHSPGKPRGRAVHHEPMEWAGILFCLDHE